MEGGRLSVRGGGYRDHSRTAPRVYRSAVKDIVRHGALTLMSLAVTVLIGVGFWDGALGFVGIGLGVFLAGATLLLAWSLVEKVRTRIVMDDDGITSETATKSVFVRWEQVRKVDLLAADRRVSYLLYGPGGEQIDVHDGLRDAHEAIAEIRRRLPSLIG